MSYVPDNPLIAQSDHTLLLETLSTWPVEVLPSAAGLHLSAYAELPADLPERAAAQGLALDTIAAHRQLPGRDGLFLGYGAVRTDSLPDGLELLAELAGWA